MVNYTSKIEYQKYSVLLYCYFCLLYNSSIKQVLWHTNRRWHVCCIFRASNSCCFQITVLSVLSLFGIFTNQSIKYKIYVIISIKNKLNFNIMCIKMKLTYLRYGNTSRWSIEVNIPVASKPFWSYCILVYSKFQSK